MTKGFVNGVPFPLFYLKQVTNQVDCCKKTIKFNAHRHIMHMHKFVY